MPATSRSRKIYDAPVAEVGCKCLKCQQCGSVAHYKGSGAGFDVFECVACLTRVTVRTQGAQHDHPCRDELVMQLRCLHPDLLVETEYAFKKGRRWRADIRIVHTDAYSCDLLIEIEGGTWVGGRHTRGSGYEKDLEKYNMGAEMGFIYLRYTPEMVQRGEALAQIERVLNA